MCWLAGVDSQTGYHVVVLGREPVSTQSAWELMSFSQTLGTRSLHTGVTMSQPPGSSIEGVASRREVQEEEERGKEGEYRCQDA